MNSKIFFVTLLVLAGMIIFGLSAKQKEEISATASQRIETRTMGAVEVEVTPVSVDPGKEVVFKLSLSTHSVELNYDYTQIATLTDEQGNVYKPIKWTGGNSGHHLEGELSFDVLLQNPKELTFALEGIDNKSETFIWKL